jgi:hypothetical protein
MISCSLIIDLLTLFRLISQRGAGQDLGPRRRRASSESNIKKFYDAMGFREATWASLDEWRPRARVQVNPATPKD